MPVMTNQPLSRVVIRDTANASYVIAGAAGVSNVATTTETVSSAIITGVRWASDGVWTIKRGANTVAILPGTGFWELTQAGNSIVDFPNATLVANCSSANCTLILTLSKSSTNAGPNS